jgi:hypothetical protein
MTDTRTRPPGQMLPGQMSLAELVAIFDSLFEREAYRLETLDCYDSSLYLSWQRGEPYDRAGWDQMLAMHRSRGATVCRVHLLPVVLTDYLVHELDFYRGSVEAGEDIRVMRKNEIAGVPDGYDYWLFDRRLAAVMDYDKEGVCTGVTVTEDLAIVQKCVQWRDEAMAKAVTLAEYDREEAG